MTLEPPIEVIEAGAIGRIYAIRRVLPVRGDDGPEPLPARTARVDPGPVGVLDVGPAVLPETRALSVIV